METKRSISKIKFELVDGDFFHLVTGDHGVLDVRVFELFVFLGLS